MEDATGLFFYFFLIAGPWPKVRGETVSIVADEVPGLL
jgi:hypothetical protein